MYYMGELNTHTSHSLEPENARDSFFDKELLRGMVPINNFFHMLPSHIFRFKTRHGGPPPRHYAIFGQTKGEYLQKLSKGSKTLHMTSESSGEMFEGYFADKCAGKFPLVSMLGRAKPSSMHRWEARTPIRAS